ncbi:hypothetical protein [Flavobacterium sp. LC2016-23]|uniref:hypothetical protein n=1 Tax=Flavobacterium sp. LC2016-23 TaxID=2666330 RepID=UPI0018A1FC98|nr:hypothetical protein [Flavobacterium sp. LC2016-23]
MKTSYTVLITDQEHEFYNQRLQGFCAYYDIHRTGSGPDLYIAETPEGVEFNLLSDQIDLDDYDSQKLAKQVIRLGANVNDVVMITRLGSGSYGPNFDLDQPHVITKIFPSGQVIFDNGKADTFQPDVTLYTGEKPVQNDFTKKAINNGLPF